MKYILIALLFTTNLYAKCGDKTIEDINECVVNDKITQFVDYESCNWPEDTQKKDMTFENLICDPVVPLSFFETKLQEWKDENIARVTEELRLKDVKDRLKALGIKFGKYDSVNGVRSYMTKCGHNDSNTALFIKEVFKAQNVALLECFESKKAEIDQEKTDRETKETEKESKRLQIKGFDCETISEAYTKLLCEVNKE